MALKSMWVKVSDSLPAINVPVLCKLQHWHTKNIQEHLLIYVNEDDVSWRTSDDHSELSYDYNVIEWKKEVNE